MKRKLLIGLVVLLLVSLAFIVGLVRGQAPPLETAEIHFNIIEGITDLELQDMSGIPIPLNRIWLGDLRRGEATVYQFQAVNVGVEQIGLQQTLINAPAFVTLEPSQAVFLSAGGVQIYTLTFDIPLTVEPASDFVFQIEFWE